MEQVTKEKTIAGVGIVAVIVVLCGIASGIFMTGAAQSATGVCQHFGFDAAHSLGPLTMDFECVEYYPLDAIRSRPQTAVRPADNPPVTDIVLPLTIEDEAGVATLSIEVPQ